MHVTEVLSTAAYVKNKTNQQTFNDGNLLALQCTLIRRSEIFSKTAQL